MKCAIYTRVSTENQAAVEFNSCEAQEQKIKSFIESQDDLEFFQAYHDPGFTGANLNRPALTTLLADIERGEINTILVYKIDRLTRSLKDFYNLVDILNKKNINFVSITESFDTSTPSGRLLLNIMLKDGMFARPMKLMQTK